MGLSCTGSHVVPVGPPTVNVAVVPRARLRRTRRQVTHHLLCWLKPEWNRPAEAGMPRTHLPLPVRIRTRARRHSSPRTSHLAPSTRQDRFPPLSSPPSCSPCSSIFSPAGVRRYHSPPAS